MAWWRSTRRPAVGPSSRWPGFAEERCGLLAAVVRGQERATVKAALGVAEARGLATIACGVETERQVQTLAGLGCTAAQGFLFAEPRAARAVTKLLRWRGETSSREAS